VRLGWEEAGALTLERLDADGNAACIRVPVTVTGNPPVIAFEPASLADALAIGPVLWLIDGTSPGLVFAPAPSSGAGCGPAAAAGNSGRTGSRRLNGREQPAPLPPVPIWTGGSWDRRVGGSFLAATRNTTAGLPEGLRPPKGILRGAAKSRRRREKPAERFALFNG
jgi:hypothetical protein